MYVSEFNFPDGHNRFGRFTLSQQFSRAFRIYRAHFWELIGIVALVIIPATATRAYFNARVVEQSNALVNLVPATSANSDTGQPLTREESLALFQQLGASARPLAEALVVTGGVEIILTLIISVLLSAALTVTAAHDVATSPTSLDDPNARVLQPRHHLTFFGALNESAPRIGALIVGLLVFNIGFDLIVVLLTFMLYLCGLAIPILIYVNIAVSSFLIPVLVLERGNLGNALARAFYFGKSRFWRLLGALIVIQFIAVGLGIVVNIFVTPNTNPAVISPLEVIASALVNMLVMPIAPILFTLMYLDVRDEYERIDIAIPGTASAALGLDTDTVNRAGSVTAPRAPEVAAIAALPTPRPARLFTGADFQTISVLLIGVVAVGAVLLFATLGSIPR